jgi:cytochrome c553
VPAVAGHAALLAFRLRATFSAQTKETTMKRLFAMLLLAQSSVVLAADPAPVPYPEGYRDWRHVKSMVIQPGHPLYESFGGIHHLYANGKALQGYKTGRFADGAVIIFDLLEAKSDGNAMVEGSRKVVGVMHKNSRRYQDTGGWGFEGFKGDSKTERAVGANAVTACYQCHTQQKDKDFVFSSTRD